MAWQEIVKRPDPGVARGIWEAPPWVFWVIAAIAVIGAGTYGAWRMGWLRRRKAGR